MKSRPSRKDSRQSVQLRNSDLNQRRIQRHEKLIQMIQDYHRSPEEEEKLASLRKNTVFEIQLRFKRSEANHAYSFPNQKAESEQDEEEESFPIYSGRGNSYYNLNLQNEISPEPITGLTRMNSGRRVKSLDQYSSNSSSQPKLIKKKKLDLDLQYERDLTTKMKLKRSSTMNKNVIKLTPLPLPAIGISGKKVENIKTQVSPTPSHLLEKLMSKKLATETSLSPIKKPSKLKTKNLGYS